MNDVLNELINKLPESPTVLNPKNLTKIYNKLPVPKEYKILWADINKFGGYPSGLILTDRGIVIKAAKSEVKRNKKALKEQYKKDKDNNKKTKAPKIIYRIIPWEYYSPDDFYFEVKEGKNCNSFVFKCDATELVSTTSEALYKMFEAYKVEINEKEKVAEETFSAINSINVEDVMFNAAYGVSNHKRGHGIYAEEAGSILDKLSGEKSTVVGRDNAKNGPDKIVDASPIQCKYCKTATASIDACFKKNVVSGEKIFRYYDLSGKPMKIEVPSDQYISAIDCMKTRIKNGQVPGVTDPEMAFEIIRKGRITYNQACNLAKAGTIESISYDMATGAVNCLSAFGISSVVAFAQTFWITKDYKEAAKSALFTGLKVYGMCFTGGIIASQMARTGAANILNPVALKVSQVLGPKATQGIINSFRALAGKKAIYGSAAQKSFSKFLCSTAITQGIMLLTFSIPDTYKMISKKISGAQYVKNLLTLSASFTGGITGPMLAGSFINKKGLNKNLTNPQTAIIGMASGVVGGAVLGTGAKKVLDIFKEDEHVVIIRLFNAVLMNLFIDNLLSDSEQDEVIELLNNDEKCIKKLNERLIKSNFQEKAILDYLEPKIKSVLDKRDVIKEIDEYKMTDSMKDILEGELAYGM